MAEGISTAVPDGRSDADAMLAQSDAEFAETFGLTSLVAPAAPAPDAPATPTPDGPGRDAQGRFVKADGTPATPEPPAPETIAETPAAPAPEGEGEEAPAAATPPATPNETTAGVIADPITPFKVFDADGELDIPNIEVEVGTKEHGTERMRLDKVVRLAKQGRYNESLQQEVQDVRLRMPVLEREHAEMAEQLRGQMLMNRRLLTDPAFLDQAIAAYEAANTPEQVNARLRERIAQLESQKAQPQGDTAAPQEFVSTKLEPLVNALLTDNPLVSFEEVWGRFTLLTAPLTVNGQVPPQKWNDALALLERELGPWMAQLQEHRAAHAAQRATDSAATRRAQEEATQAKRRLARRVAPARGTPTTATTPAAPSKQPETAQEAVDQIMGAVAAQVRGTAAR